MLVYQVHVLMLFCFFQFLIPFPTPFFIFWDIFGIIQNLSPLSMLEHEFDISMLNPAFDLTRERDVAPW